VAESCHLTIWNPRLLRLRARGFAPLTSPRSSSLFWQATLSAELFQSG
jgi:hypothetical protein